MRADVRDLIVRLLDAAGLDKANLASSKDADGIVAAKVSHRKGDAAYYYAVLINKVPSPEKRSSAISDVAADA